jgi:hypothetical protein
MYVQCSPVPYFDIITLKFTNLSSLYFLISSAMVENTRGVPPVKETSRNLSSLWDAKEFSESAETPLSLIHTHNLSLSPPLYSLSDD